MWFALLFAFLNLTLHFCRVLTVHKEDKSEIEVLRQVLNKMETFICEIKQVEEQH